MVTKLRRFSRKKGLKIFSFALTVFLLVSAIIQTYYIFYASNLNIESLFVKDYVESDGFRYGEITPAINDVLNKITVGKKLDYIPKYFYYYTDGEKYYNNITLSEIIKLKYHYEYDGEIWFPKEKPDDYNSSDKNDSDYLEAYYLVGSDHIYDISHNEAQDGEMKNYTLYIGFSEEHMQQKQQEWNSDRSEVLSKVKLLVLSLVISLICIIHLITVTGRNPEDDKVHLTPYMDRIYTDIQFLLIILTLVIWFGGINNQMNYTSDPSDVLSMDQIVMMIYLGILSGIALIICGVLFLSMVRKLKARKLLKHSLMYAIGSGINKYIRSLFDIKRFENYPLTDSLNRRQIIFTVASGLLVFLFTIFSLLSTILWIFPLMLEAVVIYWYFYENRKTFEEINLGFQESLKEQMKSERMKVDLITNVSHDLKTPLTSIISYVELLSKEELPEAARDYVNILADKSGRLKNIVSDLFDLAKSTSGNLPLNMENLDLKKLIEQTLGDMEDEIEKSNIRIKTTLTESPVYIYSDGKKLYRVFQNIIGNALKYSLQGTRIFIDMEVDNKIVNVVIKNTASYDMDFTAEEILQRFNRGDKSRTTEGSGLGLSIAESFTRACGGNFKVEIDGDQFKVKLRFTISGVVPLPEMDN